MLSKTITYSFIGVISAFSIAPVAAQTEHASAPIDPTHVLRIGTSNIYGIASTFPANGDDRTDDFTFQIIPFSGSVPDQLAALNAGAIDIGEVGEVGPVIGQAGEIPLKIIAASEPWRSGEAILVFKDSPIHKIEDLKGKKVSYNRATNAQWVVTKALRKVGLTLADIQSTFLPAGTNQLAVLETGGIDAAAFIDAPLSAYEAAGGRRIVNAGDVGVDNSLIFVAADKAVETKKAAIAAFVRQLTRHLNWERANPEKNADAVAKLLRIDPAIAREVEKKRPLALRPIDAALVKNNQEIADTFLEQGVIPKALKVDSTFTTEFNAYIAP